MSQKQKLLLVGNAYWVEVNRNKALELSKWYDVVCVAHSVKGHELMGKVLSDSDVESSTAKEYPPPYTLHLLEAKGSTQGGTRFTLVGLVDLIKETNPDIILVETEPWARLFWQVVYAKKRHANSANIGLFSWENLRRPGVKGLILDQFYRVSVRCLDFVIAGNKEARELFANGGMKRELIHVDAQIGFAAEYLPEDSIESRARLRAEWGSGEDSLIIGFCGRYVEEKGVWDLLAAVRSLRDLDSNSLRSIELHFLGGGPLKKELYKIESDEEWFKIHDFVPHNKVPGIMNAWDVFVLPSKRLEENGELWEEQFGHVLLNAMGAGCLTLGSRSGAIPEVLADDGEVLFQPSDSDDLADLIQKYLENPSLAEEKIMQQRDRALNHYSFRELADRYHQHMVNCGVSGTMHK